jgi:hypothetical protein
MTMKTRLTFWMTIVLVLIVGLGGCATQQAAAPPVPSEPVVTETLAESADQVKGLWYLSYKSGAMLSLNGEANSSELTYSYIYMVDSMASWDMPADSGIAKFENGKLTFMMGNGLCKYNDQDTYEIYIVKEDGIVTGMRGKSAEPSNCSDRPFVLKEFLSYVNPSLSAKGTERAPASVAELDGTWYDETGVLHQISMNMNYETGNATAVLRPFYVLEDPWKKIGTTSAKYENGKLIFHLNRDFCEDVGETTYEFSVIVYNDKVIGIHPRLIGDDLCTERKNVLDDRILRNITP